MEMLMRVLLELDSPKAVKNAAYMLNTRHLNINLL
jgi:hypothetical protein